MSLPTAGLCIVFLWLVIYTIKYTSRRPKSLLPSSQNRRPTTELIVKHLNIRLKTETLNVLHDKLSARLSHSNCRVWRQVLVTLYDLGSLLGVMGMLLVFGLLVLTVATLSSEILHERRAHNASTVTRRALDRATDTAYESNLLRISPIIPGLTVPLSHVPLILVALVVSQIVHESGHAITAALHRIPMISCGIAVTLILPSAFVTLPAPRLDKLPPRDRLQIVSAGCFHNLVLFCLLIAAAWSGVGSIPTWIFFQDISSEGRLVVSVDHDSPLAPHLPIGTLVTTIDDFSLVSEPSDNPWDHYLLSPLAGPTQGWCTNTSLLNEALAPACIGINNSYSCFVSQADETTQYELDPIHILTGTLPRCNSSTECSSFTSCVVPRRDQQLVRISIMRNYADSSVEGTIVWKGPKDEIWEQVRVGNLRPRYFLVPSKLPELVFSFFEYAKIANFSLYLVNMLPIIALDGYQLLGVLLDLFGGIGNDLGRIDLEASNHTTRSSREGRVQRVCRTFLSFLALLLVALCALLGVINRAKQ